MKFQAQLQLLLLTFIVLLVVPNVILQDPAAAADGGSAAPTDGASAAPADGGAQPSSDAPGDGGAQPTTATTAAAPPSAPPVATSPPPAAAATSPTTAPQTQQTGQPAGNNAQVNQGVTTVNPATHNQFQGLGGGRNPNYQVRWVPLGQVLFPGLFNGNGRSNSH